MISPAIGDAQCKDGIRSPKQVCFIMHKFCSMFKQASNKNYSVPLGN